MTSENIETLIAELDQAECELEEANEIGDLEDRLEAAFEVARLSHLLFKARLQETGSV